MKMFLALMLFGLIAFVNCDVDWLPVTERDTLIEFNLEENALQIKTNSRVGSGDMMWVQLLDEHEDGSGIKVIFSKTPTYFIGFCQDHTTFTMPEAEGNEKIWTITKTKTSVTLQCNDKEIANYKFQDAFKEECVKQWALDKTGIRFKGDDNASVGYRAKIDGKWSEFSLWSDCSAECGGGIRSRSRSCNNPAPANGGAKCEGDAEETQKCNTDLCQGPCSAGNYMTSTGCQQCQKNTFSSSGATSCTNCLDGKVSGAGSTSADDCQYETETGTEAEPETETDTETETETKTETKTEEDCSDHRNHKDYRGTISTTEGGYSCLQWSADNIHTYPDAGLGNHNYCRNPFAPDRNTGGAWCYTNEGPSGEGNRKFDSCNIPKCGK